MREAYRYDVREVGYNLNSTNEFNSHSVEETDKKWSSVLNQGTLFRQSIACYYIADSQIELILHQRT